MATNVDKGLYQAPMGIEQLAQDEEPIEIEIVDPEAVNIHMGDMDISIMPGEDEDEFGQNLAELIDDGDLQSLPVIWLRTLRMTATAARTGRRPTPMV